LLRADRTDTLACDSDALALDTVRHGLLIPPRGHDSRSGMLEYSTHRPDSALTVRRVGLGGGPVS